MSAWIVTADGRAAAEQLMVDECTISRSTVVFTNPDTGQQTKANIPIYVGKCRVQQQTPGSASLSEPGEARLFLLTLSVQIPVSATGVRLGDIVTITGAACDPVLAGRKFRVQALAHKTNATSRRLSVQEVI